MDGRAVVQGNIIRILTVLIAAIAVLMPTVIMNVAVTATAIIIMRRNPLAAGLWRRQ